MPKSLNIQDIMEMLPHRFPFLLIDRVVELSDELDRVVAIKNVTMNEPQFTGHFPQAPVMPGVLIVEAMAQACAIIALSRIPEEVRKKSLFYFAGIDNFLDAMRTPDCNARNGEYRRIKLLRQVKHAVNKAAVKIDIGRNALVNLSFVGDHLRRKAFHQ